MTCKFSESKKNDPSRRLSVAPMMEHTDRHCRYFLRKVTRHTLLYTEMITTGALLHGHRHDLLDFSAREQPIALQLGGCEPDDLAKAAWLGQQWGYREINLNAGCPSNRVREGGIGASLMAEPDKVAKCVKAMIDKVDIPVTVKHRTGITSRKTDMQTDYDHLCRFVETVARAGCNTFIVHARIAILEGLSPKENREVPPLEYETVYRLKRDFPELEIIINGGIKTLEATQEHLRQVDGVMIGREAYHNPFMLERADALIFESGQPSIANRLDIALSMVPYMQMQVAKGVPLHRITRHMIGLFTGLPGARLYRRKLSENGRRKDFSPDDFTEILHRCFQP